MSLGDSGNPTVQGRAAKLESDAAERTDMALREVLGTPAGRRVLWAIVNGSGVFGTSAAGAYPKRDYGCELIDWLQTVDAELYLLMQADAAREAKDEAALKRQIKTEEGKTE